MFDSHYLSRGLNLYESLYNKKIKFHFYIYAFDELVYNILLDLDLEFVTVIHHSSFEDEALLAVKNKRTVGEYCWTCTPAVIKHAIQKYNLHSCTYLDADLYFFSNPEVLFREFEDSSICITEHRYTKEYDQSKESGIYCVQFMFFKNDSFGMEALDWWRSACIDWCFSRYEDGKFGDQKYLDDWLVRFNKVHVLQNLGGGVAPWNIQQYNLNERSFEVVFYHFHGLKIFSEKDAFLGNYKLSRNAIYLIYKPYLIGLSAVESMLESKFNFYDRRMSYSKDTSMVKKMIKKFLNLTIRRNFNYISY